MNIQNIRTEIQAIRGMDKNRKQALVALLLALALWLGVGTFATASLYKLLSAVPVLLAILNIARVAPAPAKKQEREGQE